MGRIEDDWNPSKPVPEGYERSVRKVHPFRDSLRNTRRRIRAKIESALKGREVPAIVGWEMEISIRKKRR